jgi:hypothetical protein
MTMALHVVGPAVACRIEIDAMPMATIGSTAASIMLPSLITPPAVTR